jgi:DNA repair protein RecO (recombination protein O)
LHPDGGKERRAKSLRGSSTFFEGEIQIARSRNRTSTLTEDVEEPIQWIRRTSAHPGGFLLRRVDRACTESDHHEPELFSLLRRAFGYLDGNDPDLRAVLHFETELARIAGVHDIKMLKSNPAQALANLFGRLPSSRADLLKALAKTK